MVNRNSDGTEQTRTGTEKTILPDLWHVYAPLDREHTAPSIDTLSAVPEFIEMDGQRLERRDGHPQDGCLDLGVFLGVNVNDEGLPGYYQDAGKTAYVLIPFELTRDEELTVGLGADWWFAAWLDGEELTDTLTTGNGKNPPRASDFQKSIQVRQGKHVLAVRCIGGGVGACLCVSLRHREADRQPQPSPEVVKREWVVASIRFVLITRWLLLIILHYPMLPTAGDLLLVDEGQRLDLVLGAVDGVVAVHQALQGVLLAPAGPDGIALIFLDLVKCGDFPGACRLLADGANYQITVGDIEGAGRCEVADDRLGLELDSVVA